MRVSTRRLTNMMAQIDLPFSQNEEHSRLVVRLLRGVQRLPPLATDLPIFFPLRLKRYSFRHSPENVGAVRGGGGVSIQSVNGDCKQQ